MDRAYLHHIADNHHLLLLNDILQNNKYIQVIIKKIFKCKYELYNNIALSTLCKHNNHKLAIKNNIINRRIYPNDKRHLKPSNNNSYLMKFDINGSIK